MSREPRHLLLIAGNFPPSSAIMSRRMLRFARGLTARGLRVSVITKQERFYLSLDPAPSEAEDERYRVIRTPTAGPRARFVSRTLEPARSAEPGSAAAPSAAPVVTGTGWKRRLVSGVGKLLQKPMRPDDDLGWLPYVLRAAAKLHREQPIDWVLASAPPYSGLIAGAMVARRSGASFIADYRDPWAVERDRDNRGLGWLGQRVESWQERRVLRASALTLFTSPTARDFYRRQFPSLGRSELLFNGIDGYVEGPGPSAQPPLVWLHAGLLYMGRSLAPLVRALKKVDGELDAKLTLIGARPEEELSVADSLGISERVDWRGPKPRDETLRTCRSAHRLVAVISPAHPHSIPGKIFDYLSTSRPILLLCNPEHAAARLLADSPEHKVIDPEDEPAIAALLREDAARLRDGVGLSDIDRADSLPFEAERQMDELHAWLDELRSAR